MPSISNVIYVAGPDLNPEQASIFTKNLGGNEPLWLSRRKIHIGWVTELVDTPVSPLQDIKLRWRESRPTKLPGLIKEDLTSWRNEIERSLLLMKKVARGDDCAEIFKRASYAASLSPCFEFIASSHNEFDLQEICTLEFDVKKERKVIAENLWIKLSWLSYERNDTSLRFRFSFGHEGYEDIAINDSRQAWIAKLAEAVFPECAILSKNLSAIQLLQNIINAPALNFVERIVYFNAPNGGAQFHQDVERGHAGVIYAQLHGRTAWLALSKNDLVDEIILFLNQPDIENILSRCMPQTEYRQELYALARSRNNLSLSIEDKKKDSIEALLNRTPDFIKQLIEHGHAYVLHPGDVIVLPQHNNENCTWHSVFCLDHFPGQALSFAIKANYFEEELC